MKVLGATKRFDLIIVAFLAVTSVTGLGLVLLTFSSLLNRSTVSDISEEILTFVNDRVTELVAQHHTTHPKIASTPAAADIQIPVLLIAYSRPNVSRAIEHVLKNDALWQDRRRAGFVKSNIARWPLIVSQDGAHQGTAEVIRSYSVTGQLIHLRHPVLEPPAIPPRDRLNGNHYWVARHYRWALEQVFDILGYEYILILEDDMEISPDFFDYFAAFLPLLQADKTLYCISSWNDNGKHFRVNATDMFYRTDFFPGLGWMMTKELWAELKPKWPRAFWDDWMRTASVRQGRSCIRPEVSRNFNFGEKGASNGQFYHEHIAPNVPNKDYVDYSSIDVMKFKKVAYDKSFLQRVYRLSLPASTAQLQALQNERNLSSHPFYFNNPNALFSAAGITQGSPPTAHPALHPNTPFYCGQHCLRRYTVYYSSRGSTDWVAFVVEAKRWGLMSDVREGVPRGVYMGIVCFKVEFKYPRPRTLFSHQQPGADISKSHFPATTGMGLPALNQQSQQVLSQPVTGSWSSQQNTTQGHRAGAGAQVQTGRDSHSQQQVTAASRQQQQQHGHVGSHEFKGTAAASRQQQLGHVSTHEFTGIAGSVTAAHGQQGTSVRSQQQPMTVGRQHPGVSSTGQGAAASWEQQVASSRSLQQAGTGVGARAGGGAGGWAAAGQQQVVHGLSSEHAQSAGADKSRSLQQAGGASLKSRAGDQRMEDSTPEPVIVDGILESHFEVCLAPHVTQNILRLMNQP